MSVKRWATKRDSVEPAIIQALEQIGAEVWALDYPVDLLVRFQGRWHLLECKTGHGKAQKVARDKRQQAQWNFIESTGTPVVRTPVEAIRAIGAA